MIIIIKIRPPARKVIDINFSLTPGTFPRTKRRTIVCRWWLTAVAGRRRGGQGYFGPATSDRPGGTCVTSSGRCRRARARARHVPNGRPSKQMEVRGTPADSFSPASRGRAATAHPGTVVTGTRAPIFGNSSRRPCRPTSTERSHRHYHRHYHRHPYHRHYYRVSAPESAAGVHRRRTRAVPTKDGRACGRADSRSFSVVCVSSARFISYRIARNVLEKRIDE